MVLVDSGFGNLNVRAFHYCVEAPMSSLTTDEVTTALSDFGGPALSWSWPIFLFFSTSYISIRKQFIISHYFSTFVPVPIFGMSNIPLVLMSNPLQQYFSSFYIWLYNYCVYVNFLHFISYVYFI